MKILITNFDLSLRAGTQLYVRDIARELLRRGHSPFIYAPALGELAQELKNLTIPVVDNLNELTITPDIIHGQHHLQTMTALLRFPRVPAVYFCHGWVPWEEAAPKFPRILRYVAVDYAVRDRLLFEHGIPEEKVRIILNFADLERFKPRDPLPSKPKRALVFSNYAREGTYLSIVREACEKSDIKLDVVGVGVDNLAIRPEEILGKYDLVFAKARAAIEAMAVGASVILCDVGKVGPMITSSEFDKLRPVNFGIRAPQVPIELETLMREIARYDAQDAALVSRRIRQEAGHQIAVDAILSVYQEVLDEKASMVSTDLSDDLRAASEYLRWLSPRLKEYDELKDSVSALQKTRLILMNDLLLRLPFVRKWIQKKYLDKDLIAGSKQKESLNGFG